MIIFSGDVYAFHSFRHILASLHFNENLQRDSQLSKDGENYFRVTYPKYKLGEEVVQEVASPPTYGKSNHFTNCKMNGKLESFWVFLGSFTPFSF